MHDVCWCEFSYYRWGLGLGGCGGWGLAHSYLSQFNIPYCIFFDYWWKLTRDWGTIVLGINIGCGWICGVQQFWLRHIPQPKDTLYQYITELIPHPPLTGVVITVKNRTWLHTYYFPSRGHNIWQKINLRSIKNDKLTDFCMNGIKKCYECVLLKIKKAIEYNKTIFSFTQRIQF